MKLSRGCILGATGFGIVLALLVLVASITSTPDKIPHCPACNSTDVAVLTRFAHATDYRCRACGKNYSGPAQVGFSWWDAIEGLLESP